MLLKSAILEPFWRPFWLPFGLVFCFFGFSETVNKKQQKSDSEGVPDSDWILDAYRERPKTGQCGSNAVNSISNSLPADRPQVRFWSPVGFNFGSLLASFCDIWGFRKVSKKASNIRRPKYQNLHQHGLQNGLQF